MIVTDLKCALLRQRHTHRIWLCHLSHQFGELPAVEDPASLSQLLQMLLRQLYERGKYDRGRCAGRIKILILDGRVDTGICCVLHSLQHSKQPSKHIGLIAALFIQFHRQYLLWNQRRCISCVIGLQDRGFSARDRMLGANAERDAVQKRGRIAAAGQNCTQKISRQLRRGIAVFSVRTPPGGFPCQIPHRQTCTRIEGRPNDRKRGLVRADMRGEQAQAVAQEEPDGKPCGVWRKAEKIDVLLRQKRLLQKLAGLSLCQQRQRPADVLLLHA